MKRSRFQHLPAFIVVILSVILTSCRETPRADTEPKPSDQSSTQQVDPPMQIISYEEAKVLYDDYTRRRVPLIEKTEGPDADGNLFVPARFTSFDYATIKQYIAYIEQEATNAQVDISNLRFYFGTYPKDKLPAGVAELANAGRNTIFVVPTLQRNGEEYGFYIQTAEDGTKKAVPLSELMSGAEGNGDSGHHPDSQRAYAGFAAPAPPSLYQSGGGSLILNRGNSGPPPKGDF